LLGLSAQEGLPIAEKITKKYVYTPLPEKWGFYGGQPAEIFDETCRKVRRVNIPSLEFSPSNAAVQ